MSNLTKPWKTPDELMASNVDKTLAQWSAARFDSKQSLHQQGSLISTFSNRVASESYLEHPLRVGK